MLNKVRSKKIVLVGTSDELVRLIIENQDKLDEKFVHNYPSLEILNQILVKDTFYQNFDNCEFEIPKTYIYSCNANQTIDEEKVEKLMYP